MLSHYSTRLSGEELKNYFLSGIKKKEELEIGVEWEKLGVYRDTGQAIAYGGPRGVKAIFSALSKEYGWEPILASDGQPIALKRGASSITLEPGGQIELSGQKAFHLDQNARELFLHLKEVKEVSQPLGIAWLGLGAQPFSVADDIEWVPKDRYTVMREKLAGKGALTYAMMKETASVQISLDYLSEDDAVEKLRLAMALAPILTALFANAPLEKGRITRFYSRRANIWRHTAPERSGIIWKIFERSFTLDDYVEYALNVPLLFLQRNGQWLGTDGIRFKDYIQKGWHGFTAEPEDWDLHLTSIFTEARIKKYIELRTIDCQRPEMGLAAVAFVKGLFYHEPSRQAAWKLLESSSLEERVRLAEETPREALQTRLGDATLLELCQKLLALAKEGLSADEKIFLQPLEKTVERGQCPAQILLENLAGETAPEALLKNILRNCET